MLAKTPARSRLLVPLTAAAAVCLALGGALPAQAASHSGRGAIIDRGTISGPDNLCGIETTVSGTYQAVFTPTHDGGFEVSVFRNRLTETAANGKSVTLAGTEVDRFREVQNADGTVTITTEILGSPERISVPGHGIVTIDAGRIRIVDVLDFRLEDPLVSSTTKISGPHPEWESEFNLGCEVITAALS